MFKSKTVLSAVMASVVVSDISNAIHTAERVVSDAASVASNGVDQIISAASAVVGDLPIPSVVSSVISGVEHGHGLQGHFVIAIDSVVIIVDSDPPPPPPPLSTATTTASCHPPFSSFSSSCTPAATTQVPISTPI